jgi:hypothetical protein
MSDERVPFDVQSLWQRQPATSGTMSLDELRLRSQYVTRRVSRRNLREYVAAVIAAIVFGPMAWFAPLALIRVGSVLSLAGVAFVVYYLHRHGSAQAMPQEMGLTSGLAFYRHELERQRDLLRGVWKWALLPLMPGLITMALAHPERTSGSVWIFAGILALFALIGGLNRRVAKKIQVKIDQLERDS